MRDQVIPTLQAPAKAGAFLENNIMAKKVFHPHKKEQRPLPAEFVKVIDYLLRNVNQKGMDVLIESQTRTDGCENPLATANRICKLYKLAQKIIDDLNEYHQI